MPEVKMYGGPLHGKTHFQSRGDSDRIMCHNIQRIPPMVNWRRGAPIEYSLPEYVSYTIEIFQERRGTMRRQIHIGVIDGIKNLLEHERWEIECDLRGIPWEPNREPSILKEFDSWWNQTLYRHTGHEYYLYPEFEKRPYA